MSASCAVLFDLDGTLCDREATWRAYLASQHARFDLGSVPLATYQARALELQTEHRSNRLRVFQQLQSEFALTLTPETLFADFRFHIAAHTSLYEGTREVLELLRARGWRLGVVTNGSAQAQSGKLETTGIGVLFDTILISEVEGLRKPDPAIFERAAHNLGMTPRECIFVGDDPSADIGGAHAAGMETLWLSCGQAWPSEFDFVPDFVAVTLREVADLLTF